MVGFFVSRQNSHFGLRAEIEHCFLRWRSKDRTITLWAGATGSIYIRPNILWVFTDDVMVSSFPFLDMHVKTSRWLSRADRESTSFETCSTRKKSSFWPTETVLREAVEKPLIFFTPNRDEMKSLMRNAHFNTGDGREVMMPHASSGVTDLESRIVCWSKKSSSAGGANSWMLVFGSV